MLFNYITLVNSLVRNTIKVFLFILLFRKKIKIIGLIISFIAMCFSWYAVYLCLTE